jgi:hypothetical protein
LKIVLQASLDVGIALILIQGSLPSSWSPLNNGAPATQLPSFKFHDFQQPSFSGCPDFPTACSPSTEHAINCIAAQQQAPYLEV